MIPFIIEYSLKQTDAHTHTFTHTHTHNVILSHTCSNNPDFTTAAQAACFDNNSVGRKHFQTTDPCLTAALLSLTNATRRPILIKQDVIIFHSHPLRCLEPDKAPPEKSTKCIIKQREQCRLTNTLSDLLMENYRGK